MKYFFTCCIALLWLSSYGQNTDNFPFSKLHFKEKDSDTRHIYVIRTISGSSIRGELLGIEGDQMLIETKELGILALSIKDIERIKLHDSLGPHFFDRPMVGAGHYFLTPSAYNLRAGEINLQSPQLFAFLGSYGISSNFSIAGGSSFFPGFKLENQLFYVMPKFTLKASQHVRFGLQYTHIYQRDFGNKGLMTLVGTVGQPDRNLTFGITTQPLEGQGEESLQGLAFNFGGVFRFTNEMAIVVDGFITGDKEPIDTIGIGIRSIMSSGVLDVGILFHERTGTIPLPYLSYVIGF